MSSRVLPDAWVERLFARFGAAFGAQKVAAMFPPESHAEVRALWAEQLGRFESETLRLALQASIDAGREWPPTLSEFVAHCQHASVARRQHQTPVMLPLPRATPEVVEREVAAAARVASTRRGGKEWARRIVDRHAAGDAASLAVLTMARRALGMPTDGEIA